MMQPIDSLPVFLNLKKRGTGAALRIFIDTCFMLKPRAFAALSDAFFQGLAADKNPIIVTLAVIRELNKHAASKTNPELAQLARAASERLTQLEQIGAIRRIGEAGDPFADQNFIEVFTRFRPKYNLMLLTQDFDLSKDLLRLNNHKSVESRNRVFIGKHFPGVNAPESIRIFDTETDFDHATFRSHSHQPVRDEHPFPKRHDAPIKTEALPLFNRCTTPRVLDETLVGSGGEFSSGSVVLTAGKTRLNLGASIARGGEGEIFHLDDRRVAKVYFHDRRTRSRLAKLELMCTRNPGIDGLIWPSLILYDSGGHFVGYVMPKAKGRPLQHTVFGKPNLEKNFPHWTRHDLVTLAHSCSRLVEGIHHVGLLIGDINPMNFLVASPSEVYLVDADSFQVEDFPCPVGMANFKAPEITAANFNSFLRTKEHESFAFATLLFMILMGGKAPFSYQGGGDPAENIRQGNFPYTKDRSAIPAGAFRYIWSHLPYGIQKAFENTFAHTTPERRSPAHVWTKLLNAYIHELEQESDTSGALAIWPAAFKIWDKENAVQLECSSCHTHFITTKKDAEKRKQFRGVLCGTCVSLKVLTNKTTKKVSCSRCKAEHEIPSGWEGKSLCSDCNTHLLNAQRTCSHCSGVFQVTKGEIASALRTGNQLRKSCAACENKEAAIERRCRYCQAPFTLTASEIRFFWQKAMSLPTSCKGHRGQRRPVH